MNIQRYLDEWSIKKQDSILSASVVLAITFGVSALLGFLRNRLLIDNFFGCCTADLDVYNAAFRIPDLIFKLLVTGALSSSFIPVFSHYLHHDPKVANKLASSVVNLLVLAFLAITIIIIIFARPFSLAITDNFSAHQIDLMVNLTRILMVGQIFFLISNFATAILQVQQVFLVPALAPVVYNLAIIASIYLLSPIVGIYGATYGAVIGAFFHLLIQLPLLRKIGYHHTFDFDLHLQGVKEVVRLMIPRSLSLGLGEIENTVTLFFASSLSSGSITLLNLAITLMYLPSRIFATTIGQASLPILSKNIAKNEFIEFRNTVNKTIIQSLFITIPIACLVIIERVAIVRIIFGVKHFPWAATLITAKTLAFLAPAIIFQALIQILIRAFYALHNTKVPLYVAALSLISTVVSSFYFINFTNLGIVGLAIGSTIGDIFQCVGMIFFYFRRVDGDSFRLIFHKTFQISLATTLMSAVMWGLLRLLDLFVLDTTRTLNVVVLFSISCFVGLAVYIGACQLVGLKEYQLYYRRLTRFLNRH